ncbi:MAG: hypothetical protein PHU85_03520 [Phycisphaerae bacterium]|nr:hypothetical protein [Phycisphaerae bacterium]
MSKRTLLVVPALAVLGLLVGCEPKPTIEFTSPRVMVHVEAPQITNVEKIRGDIKIEKLSNKMFRVEGTGVVRVELPPNMTHQHTVDVTTDKIRVHGVDVESRGAMRDVYMEDKVLGGVHPDRVK